MPIQYIIDYLKENRDKFPLDVLKKKLIEAGYPEKEIGEAIKIIQKPKEISISFWDFRHKKIYTSKREKFLDFIFGIFAGIIIPLLISRVASFFGILLPYSFRYEYGFFRILLNLIFYLGLLIYFFKIKRGYISFGMIFSFPLLIFIGFLLLLDVFIF